MTTPGDLKPALDVVAGIEELAQAPERLGNQWALRYATVINVVDAQNVIGRYDNEVTDVDVPMISLVGQLIAGIRVAVFFIPPSGNYITHVINGENLTTNRNISSYCTGSNTTSSAVYVNMSGNTANSVSFPKRATRSAVEVFMSNTLYTTASAGVEFGVSLNGTDYLVAALRETNSATNSHQNVAGCVKIAGGLAAGTYTVQQRWRRTSGAGALNRDLNDWMTMYVKEVDAT